MIVGMQVQVAGGGGGKEGEGAGGGGLHREPTIPLFGGHVDLLPDIHSTDIEVTYV